MEPVVTLGLSVLPNTTELVVIRGQNARGTVLDRAVTETRADTSANGLHLRRTVDNVLQTRALAIAHGYDVDAVRVLCDGTVLTSGLIVALKSAGLRNVSALEPAIAREIFTQSAIDDVAAVAAGRARSRRRWIFVAAMVIALSALTFAIVDRWQAAPHPGPPRPTFTPPPHTSAPPPPPVVETPPPVAPPPPAAAPTEEAPRPAPPTYTPLRRAPVQQQQPTQRPAPPPSATPPAPAEPLEPAPSDDCMFLCGVTL